MNKSSLPLLAGALLAGVLSLASLSAQTPSGDQADAKPPKAKMSIEERLAKMKDKLALTDDQVASLKTIFEEQKTKIDPIFQDTSLTREQKREKAKPIMEETKTKIDAVLTPDQKTKFDEMRKARRDKSKEQ